MNKTKGCLIANFATVPSNELTEAAYYLSLKAKRVLWLCLMQTYFTASVSEDDDEMAVLGDSTFKVKVADYQQIFQVSRNQAIKDVKEGVFELSRSAVIFYPKEGSFDCVARPWLTEAGSRSARGIWEIEFNHKLLRYIYGLTNQFTTYSLRDCGSLRNPRTIRLYESLAQFKSSGLWVTTHAWLNDRFLLPESQQKNLAELKRHCCKVSDEAAFCLIQRPYISKTLLTRRISPRGSP